MSYTGTTEKEFPEKIRQMKKLEKNPNLDTWARGIKALKNYEKNFRSINMREKLKCK